jgi:hypothetical protein
MAAIIASGTSELASSDIVVVAGTPTTVFLNDASTGNITESAKARVQIKAASGTYTTVGELNRNQPALIIDGPGTYRVLRLAGSGVAFAVDQD